VQTTLLGLAIAFILALVAALIGPHFIDWNKFRPQFEAEATRVLGAPVRVGGELDARLLPTPSLRLRSVALGGANDDTAVRADKLDVEFSLGSLMRGEWRATELTLSGLNLDFSLDKRGKIVWPLADSSLNLGSLTIDRLKLAGRASLHDTASGSTITLDDIAFNGDVRTSAGAARGDGDFSYDGVRYPFRLSSSRGTDGTGTRLHVNVDPAERPVGVDLDGLLSFESQVPHFDGAVTLSRAIALRAGGGNGLETPWKLSAKVKADSSTAKFEQLEAVYGSDDVGLKLAGTADLTFGATPSLRAVLSARQLDADRLLAKETSTTEPTQLLSGLRSLVASVPAARLATRIEIGADQITLGGRPVQNIATAIHSDDGTWIIDRFEGRAPGATQVVLAGQLAASGTAAAFKGDLKLDSSDPDVLMRWLRGQGDQLSRSQTALRASGTLSVTSDRIALDDIKADINGGTIGGYLALSEGLDGQAKDASKKITKLDAGVKAERVDLDDLAGFIRSFAGPQSEWPDEAQLALDIGHGILSGQDMSPVIGRLGYGPASITLAGLKIGGAGGVLIEGNGVFDRAASGQLTLSATAGSFPQVASLLAPILPASAAAHLRAVPVSTGGSATKLTLSVNLDKARSDRSNAVALLDIQSSQLKGTIRASATPSAAALRTFDVDALARSELNIESKLSADQSRSLLALLGLDRIIAAGDGPAQLESTATGIWKSPLRFKAKISGTNLDADVQGTAEPFSGSWFDDPKATVMLAARKIDIMPLFDVKPAALSGSPISLSSRMTVAGSRLTFDEIDSTISGSHVRGHLAFVRGKEPSFDGELGMETLDLGAVFGLAMGVVGQSPEAGSAEPLSRDLLRGVRGRLGFQAIRGVLPGGMEAKSVSGVVKGNDLSLAFDDLKGTLAGGEAKGDVAVNTSGSGMAIDAHVRLDGASGDALTYRGLAMPAGRTSLQMTLATRGRSVGALTGALSGNGLLSIDNARIPGLDVRAFDEAVKASDTGQVDGDSKLREVVATALNAAPLPVASVQIPFNIRDGSVRVESTSLDGEGAKVTVSGGYDIAADQVDIRANLVSTAVGPDNNRPEIQIFSHGSPDHLNRTVDVASLSSWLAVRAIDRETRRLDAMERGEPAPPQQISTPPTTAAIPAPFKDTAPNAVPPATGVPIPGREPRRREQKAKTFLPPTAPVEPSGVSPPQASNFSAPAAQVQPLPPPIDVRPPPGPPRQKPRGPLVLTPPLQN
jgi:large subunit ribosomal protein L24